MLRPKELRTPRLLLRQWRETDRTPYAVMNADPEVMRFFPATQPFETSLRSIEIWQAEIEQRGWSNWAVELAESQIFIGFIGLSVPKRVLPFTPCVEVGYRLAKEFWNRGLASEGARRALDFAFDEIGLTEVVSFTALLNTPSQAVMRRIGMLNAEEDFDHPAVPEGSPLRRHCLYRIDRHRWSATK
jgi:RimJ/RimL family protein N-acetyltransferase